MCAVVAVIAGLAAQIASHRPQFSPSLLLNVADGEPLSHLIAKEDPGFAFTTGADHYDGVYLWAMARDPFASGEAHQLIDMAAYRYGHPMYSWIARILALGQPHWLDGSFWLLSLLSLAAAAVCVSLLAAHFGASPWWGLLVAASPGLLFSATTDLSEPFQLALVAGLLLLWSKGAHPGWITLVCAVMALTKEQLILVPLGLGIALVMWMAKHRRLLWGRALALLATPVALGLWLPFIRSRFSADQLHYDTGNISAPVLGWLDTFTAASALRHGDMNASQIGSTVPAAMITIAVIMLIGAVIGLKRHDGFGIVIVLQAILISCFSWRTILYPHEMFRLPAVPVLLASLLIAITLTTHRAQAAGAQTAREKAVGV